MCALTDVVRADLEGLVPSHDEPDLSSGGRLEDLDLSGSTLLPLGRRLVESEQLGSPARTRSDNKVASRVSWRLGLECHRPKGRSSELDRARVGRVKRVAVVLTS